MDVPCLEEIGIVHFLFENRSYVIEKSSFVHLAKKVIKQV